MSKGLKTLLAGAALLLVWGALAAYTAQMSLPSLGGGIAYDPLFVPQLLIGAGIVLAIILMVQGIRPLLAGIRIADEEPQKTGRILFVIVAVGLYFAAMPVLGFPLSSAVFLLVFAFALGYRKPVGLVATAILGPLVIWYVFTAGLEAPLPAWPSF
ncbi:tripartite tricarboxylate transporter TctB family protein [Amorphus coralli]|uniref:tripartite tricarboxylate transporter TctB family protein n=1 Tax=Amorphus coralli TaxID=340680 RepID=UPI00035F106C|nr:tripartite tricarboxylate transporter TctB family protein [Amorphus coralli]